MEEVQTVTPAPAPVTPPVDGTKKSSTGTLIGMLIILVAVVLGAWYMWNQRTDMGTRAADVSSLEAQSTSTDAAAIESDLSAQSPDDFDSGVDQAFGELDASFDAK